MRRIILTIDDQLLRQARRQAATQQRRLRDVIQRALLRGLTNAPRATRATVTYGNPAAAGPDNDMLRDWADRLDNDLAGLRWQSP